MLFSFTWSLGSPFPVPHTKPGPDVTEKKRGRVASEHKFPDSSTTLARRSATSPPSRYTLLPVPVAKLGASSVSCRAAGVPHECTTCLATTVVLSLARASAVRLEPGENGTAEKVASP